MSESTGRIFWPFEVPSVDDMSPESRAKVAFLEAATAAGFKSYVDESDCGALGGDRECWLVWRGKHRSELVLIERGQVIDRSMLVDCVPWLAFDRQVVTGLDWLRTQAKPQVLSAKQAAR